MNWYTSPPPLGGPNPNEGIPIFICFVKFFCVLLTGLRAPREKNLGLPVLIRKSGLMIKNDLICPLQN